MDAIIISSMTLEDIKNNSSLGLEFYRADLNYNAANKFITIREDSENIESSFEEWELEVVSKIENKKFYSCEFNSFELLKELLKDIKHEYIIDNDNDGLLSPREFETINSFEEFFNKTSKA
jgi:hypothetical protein